MFAYASAISGNIHKELAMPVVSGKKKRRTVGQKGSVGIFSSVHRLLTVFRFKKSILRPVHSVY